jgi:hypothetical protein
LRFDAVGIAKWVRRISSLNKYGDILLKTTGAHGADIASQRIDELDVEALRFAMSKDLPAPIALDLGCGLGMHGMRLAMLAVDAHLYDLLDISDRIRAFKVLFPSAELHFHKLDLRENMQHRLPAKVGLSYSQRFIHYLRYEEACCFLGSVFHSMMNGGRLFLSASGLNSELRYEYAAGDQPFERRFGPLEPRLAEKHQIHEDICLYTEGDLRQLAAACGFDWIDVWSSSFGNVKGIFVKH